MLPNNLKGILALHEQDQLDRLKDIGQVLPQEDDMPTDQAGFRLALKRKRAAALIRQALVQEEGRNALQGLSLRKA